MTDGYRRLKQRIAEKEQELQQRELAMVAALDQVKISLQPRQLLAGAVNNAFSGGSKLLKTGLGIGATILADRLIFKKAGTLGRAAGMFVIRKLVRAFTQYHPPSGPRP